MGYAYPDAREAVWRLAEQPIDGTTVERYLRLEPDFKPPTVAIHGFPGTEGFMSRVDRIGVDFYAEGERALQLAAAFKERIVGTNITVEDVGLLDSIDVETAPADVPYPSDRINLASAVYRVTTRPKL